ncbi:MAG: ABC transporter substrate-binding protein [Candidatus Rokuibacteriota bacterium]|nr:MAG: ABC transporter substrate-binding protein [Candidatus Rokubacteria bacterium]
MKETGVAFLVTLALLAAPLAADAQPDRVPRIGWLVFGGPFSETSPGLDAAILRGLRELGYVYGKNVALQYRYAEGRAERLPELATELVRLKVDLLLGIGGDIAVAFQKATSTIPIVVGTSTDPVRARLVPSLARPGGNLTGVTFLSEELAAKRVELLKEVMPGASRLGVLWDPAHADNDFQEIQGAARRLGLRLLSLEVRRPGDLDAAVGTAVREHVDALIVVPGRLMALLDKRITEAAASHRLAVISGWREFASVGALLTYGPNRLEGSKRVAYYVDRVLKGTKPADLPIERPTTFELVVNTKTAKVLGLTIPPSVLARADEVIE